MRILYFFPRAVKHDLQQIERGELPSDRAYGVSELRQYGHTVDVADERFEGFWAPVTSRLRRQGINPCDPKTALRLRKYDVVLVKDSFSTVITAAARMSRTKLVYLDAMFDIPRRSWRAAVTKRNLTLADSIIAYSRTQAQLWAEQFRLPSERFTTLRYSIDLQYYKPVPPPATVEPYVLSVGRDPGRSFPTLIEAMDGLGLRLKIVTLPYLLKPGYASKPWIDVVRDVPYRELLELYAGALMVAIPLRGSLSYPSGVRGLLEAMALRKAAVCTRTPVLEEYAAGGEGTLYVEPDDVSGMRNAIQSLRSDATLRDQLAARGAALVARSFSMETFARSLESHLMRL